MTVNVQLVREDEEEVSPFVIAPFFPQVSSSIIDCLVYNCVIAS